MWAKDAATLAAIFWTIKNTCTSNSTCAQPFSFNLSFMISGIKDKLTIFLLQNDLINTFCEISVGVRP